MVDWDRVTKTKTFFNKHFGGKNPKKCFAVQKMCDQEEGIETYKLPCLEYGILNLYKKIYDFTFCKTQLLSVKLFLVSKFHIQSIQYEI